MHLASPTTNSSTNASAVWKIEDHPERRSRIIDIQFRKCPGIASVLLTDPYDTQKQPMDANGWPVPDIEIPNATYVFNVTSVDPRFMSDGKLVYDACNRTIPVAEGTPKNAIDVPPMDHLVVIRNQCAIVGAEVNRPVEDDCSGIHIALEVWMIGDFCALSPLSSVCKKTFNETATFRPSKSGNTTTAPVPSATKSGADKPSRRSNWLIIVGIAITTFMATLV